MKKVLILMAVILAVSGCSSMQTTAKNKGEVKLSTYGSFTIQVRTPSPDLSSLVYEFAVQEFSKSLDIAEKEKGKGTIEITFSSQGESAFIGSSTTTANAQAYGSGWYTGNTYYNSALVQGQATTFSSGSSFTWQNSTLLVVVRDTEGRRLYSADYKYKGGWELSGWVVNTPEEAARLCIERVHKQMAKDAVL
jgi:hypothetical protein